MTNISEKVNKSNEDVRERISDANKDFQMRRFIKEKNRERDLIEALGIGGAIRRTNKIKNTSTKDF